MSKSFTKYYSRVVAGCVTLLAGLAVLFGAVIIANASSVPVSTLRVSTMSFINDGIASESPESAGDSFVGKFSDRTEGYADVQTTIFFVEHIGPSGSSGQVSVSLGGTNPNAFILSRFCFSSHAHTPQADYSEVSEKTYTPAAAGQGFSLPPISNVGDICVFTIHVRTGLTSGTYTATLNILAESGIMQNPTTSLSFTVKAPSISVSPASHSFQKESPGYTPEVLSVTVKNVASIPMPTGDLEASVNSPNFALNTDNQSIYIPSIQTFGGEATFTVEPIPGLSPGTYSATVMVKSYWDDSIAPTTLTVYFTVEGTYDISLGPDIVFDPRDEGYTNIQRKTVTVTNIGNANTGSLTVRLSNPNSFAFGGMTENPIILASIPVGLEDWFNIQPKPGLTAGFHTSTITVSNSNISRTMNVSFFVRSYGITLNPTETHIFAPAKTGYTNPPAALTATVTNIGNQPTGDLTVTITGTNSDCFKIAGLQSATTISSIATQNGTAQFTIQPIAELPEGEYTATVTVSGESKISAKSFDVRFFVGESSILLEPSTMPTHPRLFIPSAMQFTPTNIRKSATPPTALTAKITNTGNQPTGALTITLTGANPDNFILSASSLASIANPNETAVFTLRPKANLEEATHSATVTVSGDTITPQSFVVHFIVYNCCDCGLYVVTPEDSFDTTWLLALLAMVGIAILLVFGYIRPMMKQAAYAPLRQGKADAELQNILLKSQYDAAPRPQYGGQVSPSAAPPPRPQILIPKPSTEQKPPVSSVSGSPSQTPPRRPETPSTFQAARPSPMQSPNPQPNVQSPQQPSQTPSGQHPSQNNPNQQ